MRVAIFGTGGVGGYFGGRLAQAGLEVVFIARGAHRDAIAVDGLSVSSVSGDFVIKPAAVTDRPESVGAVDVVLCCVKSWQVAEAALQMRPLVGPETVVIPLLNGVDAHTTLGQTLGAGAVMPGLCKLITMIAGPGRIRHAGTDPYLAFGEMDGNPSPRARRVADTFSRAGGMTVHLSENIMEQLWRKFMLIAPWGGLGAITRSSVGVFRSLPETRAMLLAAIREVFEVARAAGIDVTETAVTETIAFIDQLPAEGTASMQRDIMAGRPSELHEQCGAVVRYGERNGVPTPVTRFVYHSLLPLEQAARAPSHQT